MLYMKVVRIQAFELLEIKGTYLLHASFAHPASSAGYRSVTDRCRKAAESGHLSISLLNTTKGIGTHVHITEGTEASQELNASFSEVVSPRLGLESQSSVENLSDTIIVRSYRNHM